jgi:Ca2+/Na+ antiporter
MAAGFILLSVTTSLPELSVSTVASLAGEGGLSAGNVLGSNIANLTIILGLAILLSRKEIALKGQSQKDLVQFLFISSIIPLFIVQRGSARANINCFYVRVRMRKPKKEMPTSKNVPRNLLCLLFFRYQLTI